MTWDFRGLPVALIERNHRSPVLYRQRVVSTANRIKPPSIYPSKNHPKPAAKRNKLSLNKLQTKIFLKVGPVCPQRAAPKHLHMHLIAAQNSARNHPAWRTHPECELRCILLRFPFPVERGLSQSAATSVRHVTPLPRAGSPKPSRPPRCQILSEPRRKHRASGTG